MGCGCCSKVTPEELKVRTEGDQFRLKLISEVQQAALSSRVSLATSLVVPQSTQLRDSSPCAAASSRSTARKRSTHGPEDSRQSARRGTPLRISTTQVPSLFDPRRSSNKVLEPSQENELTISLPGKVGCEDEKIVVNANSSLVWRTRKVHKRGFAKIIAQRSRQTRGVMDASSSSSSGSDKEAEREDEDGGVRLKHLALPAEEKRIILRVLQRHFLFSSLEAGEHETLIEQMVDQEFKKDDVVCKKGNKGDCCYIIRSGIVTVHVHGRQVANLTAGHTFGELAMLYDVPRTATIICACPRVVLCKIRGRLFRKSLARGKEQRLNEKLGFLNKHDVFSKLLLEEKKLLANSCFQQTYDPGALLIDHAVSSSAEWMFMIEEGTVEVTDQYKNRKVLSEGATISGPKTLYGQKAVAVKALSRVKCLAIGLCVISRLFGNVGEVLRRATIRSFLGDVGFFRQLTVPEQTQMAAVFQEEERFRKGEMVVSSDADPQLLIVMDGEVTLCKTGADGSPGDLSKLSVSSSHHSDPELERPHDSQGDEAQTPKGKLLRHGDVYGEAAFTEGGSMEHTLVARTDCAVYRVGYDELCRSLRGFSEKTPPLTWIVKRIEVKKLLREIFPFQPLLDDILTQVIERFEKREYAPDEPIVKLAEESGYFFLVLEGEAVRWRLGEPPMPLTKWDTFGSAQLLLEQDSDVDIAASAGGCTTLRLSQEEFADVAGPFLEELQLKMRYQARQTKLQDLVRVGVLGQGQFGVVRRVQIRGVFGVHFALKCLSKRRVIDLEQQEPTKLEREILTDCCHPCIIQMIKSYQDDHSVYLLMEEAPGNDLFTAIRDIGSLSEEQCLFFGASIVLAVEYVHSRGVIYRDMKPENIMLTGDGFVKLVDFGCCTRKQRSYTFIGTPEYVAPEVILGKGYGFAVDWWALGVVMYEMICGPLPFGEGNLDALDTYRQILEKPLSIPARIQSNSDTCHLLASLLERAPEQRLGSSSTRGEREVQEHPYFEGLQWDTILDRSTDPPYSPPQRQKEEGVSSKFGRCNSMPSEPAHKSESQLITHPHSSATILSDGGLLGHDIEEGSIFLDAEDKSLSMTMGVIFQGGIGSSSQDDDEESESGMSVDLPDEGADLNWCEGF